MVFKLDAKSQNQEQDKKGLTVKKEENFSEWYTQVLLKSGFIDYSDVSGSLVFLPSAYGAWQIVTQVVDSEFKKNGVEDVYFPLLIPEKLLEQEKDHFEGFVPEVAWVTETGNTKLEERLAIRPTSETIMYKSYSKWIRSWRDLPLRFNQWNNVLRWEFKHPTPFIRSREFLWNEGHSVFATEEEATAERDAILGIYLKTLREYFALPGILGKKSDGEKFAGAVASYSIEHMMPDGWALQGPDFHLDGQNFAKAFGISFLDKEGKKQFAWQNTYAISTRELGVMVAVHGDNKGLVLPPKLAYIQIIVIPILRKEGSSEVLKFAEEINASLKKKFRCRVDDREGYSPGYKFNDWELKGIPLRIEIGPKEMERKVVSVARRDTGAKEEVPADSLSSRIESIISEMHESMYEKAEKMLQSYVHEADDYDTLKEMLTSKKGMVSAPWCGSVECETKIKSETGAKVTNIPIGQKKISSKCIYCGKPAEERANFARSY